MDFLLSFGLCFDFCCNYLCLGLEMMSKVCLVSVNESVLAELLDTAAYRRLVELLTVQDIQLIVNTLETLYKLSKVGEPFTSRIARVHRAIGKSSLLYVVYTFFCNFT